MQLLIGRFSLLLWLQFLLLEAFAGSAFARQPGAIFLPPREIAPREIAQQIADEIQQHKGFNRIFRVFNHDALGTILSKASRQVNFVALDQELQEQHQLRLSEVISSYLPAELHREMLRNLDKANGDDLKARGSIPEDLDEDFSAALARLVRVNREGQASWDDEVATFAYTADNSAKLQIDQAAYHQGFKKIIAGAKKFFFIINFDFNAHDIAGFEMIELFKEKMKQGVEGALIFDEVGGRHTLTFGSSKQWMSDLQGAGMRVINNFSPTGVEHRKILVADDGAGGIVAQVGSSCISAQYITSKTAQERFLSEVSAGSTITPINPADQAEFHDLMIEFRREMAQKITLTVLLSLLARKIPLHSTWEAPQLLAWYLGENWQSIRPTADDYQGSSYEVFRSMPWGGDRGLRDSLHQVLDEAIASANTASVDFEVAYFLVPSVKDRLITLAQTPRPGGKKTTVSLIIPGDDRLGFCDLEGSYLLTKSWYPELLAAGVKIFEFQGYTHVKVLAINGRETIWTSSGNPEPCSWRGGHDLSFILRHNDKSQVAQDIEAMFRKDKEEKSIEILAASPCLSEPALRRVRQGLYRLGHGIAAACHVFN